MNTPRARTLDWKTLLLIFWSTGFSVGSQIMLRYGMSALSDRSGFELAVQAARTPFVLAGLVAFALGTVSWLVVLSRIDLSVAYPLGALNYVLVTILASSLLGETVPPLRWGGVLLILGGIVVIAVSEVRVPGAQSHDRAARSLDDVS